MDLGDIRRGIDTGQAVVNTAACLCVSMTLVYTSPLLFLVLMSHIAMLQSSERNLVLVGATNYNR